MASVGQEESPPCRLAGLSHGHRGTRVCRGESHRNKGAPAVMGSRHRVARTPGESVQGVSSSDACPGSVLRVGWGRGTVRRPVWARQKGLLFWVPNHNDHSEDPAHLRTWEAQTVRSRGAVKETELKGGCQMRPLSGWKTASPVAVSLPPGSGSRRQSGMEGRPLLLRRTVVSGPRREPPGCLSPRWGGCWWRRGQPFCPSVPPSRAGARLCLVLGGPSRL